MLDSTPHLITEERFNRSVEDWSIQIRTKIRRRAPVGKDSLPDDEKLVFTKSSVKKSHGIAVSVKFSISRHGIFIHYGVGRGYIRQGNRIVRGYRAARDPEIVAQLLKRGYKRKDALNYKIAYLAGTVNRKAIDWFDIEIRSGIKALADIAQEFYGDNALRAVLNQVDKAIIGKSNNQKERIWLKK